MSRVCAPIYIKGADEPCALSSGVRIATHVGLTHIIKYFPAILSLPLSHIFPILYLNIACTFKASENVLLRNSAFLLPFTTLSFISTFTANTSPPWTPLDGR
jgi:hypothetical protein